MKMLQAKIKTSTKQLILKLPTLCIFIITLASCSGYKMLDIEVLTPPAHPISTENRSLVLLNKAKEQQPEEGHHSYSLNVDFLGNSEKKKLSDDYIKVDSTTAIALHSMYNALHEATFFSSVKIEDHEPMASFGKEDAHTILDQNAADVLLVLDKLEYLDILTHIYYVFSDIESRELEVRTKSEWLVYHQGNQHAPYRFSIKDTSFWQNYNPERSICVQQAVWDNALLAARHIAPYWKSVGRIYHSGRNYVFKKIDNEIADNQWESAAQLWMTLYKGEQKNTLKKGRMAFNMALFFEVKNDLETAQMWLNEATDIFREKTAENDLKVCAIYDKVLSDRHRKEEALNQMFLEK